VACYTPQNAEGRWQLSSALQHCCKTRSARQKLKITILKDLDVLVQYVTENVANTGDVESLTSKKNRTKTGSLSQIEEKSLTSLHHAFGLL